RLVHQRSIVIGIALLYMIGFCGLLLGGSLLTTTFYMLLVGVSQGAGISLALTMFGLRTNNAEDAAELSGMAQSGGYLLAAIGPLFMGYLFDTFHSWTPSLILFLFFTVAMCTAGIGAGRNTVIQRHEKTNDQKVAQ